jgi:hypothetical protein
MVGPAILLPRSAKLASGAKTKSTLCRQQQHRMQSPQLASILGRTHSTPWPVLYAGSNLDKAREVFAAAIKHRRVSG